MNRRLLAFLLAAGALAAPAAARASTVELSATSGPAAEDFIFFRAAKGERNRVRVEVGKKTIVIVDRGVRRLVAKRIRVFGGCRQSSRQRVVCPFQGMSFLLRDGNDSISFSPGTAGSEAPVTDPLNLAEDFSDSEGALIEFAFIDAGPGDDRVYGSKSSDTIVPGTGRDKVQGRGGTDRFYLTPDGSPDSIRGNGGLDTLDYSRVTVPVNVDLAAGTANEDRVSGINRVRGGEGDDTLRGGPAGEAIYGGGGFDRIDGRGGNDLLTGEAPDNESKSANDIVGGGGDDVIDARNKSSAPTSRVDCGPGSDRETGEVDDRVSGCELAAFRLPPEFESELPYFDSDALTKISPVARAADEAPTYEVACPSEPVLKSGTCAGTVKLERPPAPGSTAVPEVMGSGSFSLATGQRANVAVTLTVAGRAAITAGQALAVHVTGNLTTAPAAPTPATIDFGWQQQPLGAPKAAAQSVPITRSHTHGRSQAPSPHA